MSAERISFEFKHVVHVSIAN